MTEIGIILLIFLVCATISVSVFNIVNTHHKNEAMLKMQIEASKVKKTDHINTMKPEDQKKFIDNLIGFYVSEEILKTGANDKNDEEMSIIISNMILDISTKVHSSLSEEMVSSIYNYITEDCLKRYISSTVRLSVVAKLHTKK